MAYKDSKDFRQDYPGAYVKNGTVYDGNNHRIGYACGDGDIRINNDKARDGQLYHMNKNK